MPATRNAMTKAQTTVLLELEKVLQTCNQINKLLVQTVEIARGPHVTEQKKAVAGMDVWKRFVDERVDVDDDEEMEVDT